MGTRWLDLETKGVGTGGHQVARSGSKQPDIGTACRSTISSATQKPMRYSVDSAGLVPVLMALHCAAFGWGISREIGSGERALRTWLPLPDNSDQRGAVPRSVPLPT